MKLFGVVPPMVTPFLPSGAVDFDSLEKLVEYLSGKVDGLFVCGSYGSGPLMSVEERKAVAEKSVATAAGRVPVVVHTGCASTVDTVALSAHAASIGAAAVSAVAPYYFHHTEKSLLGHYSAILAAVPRGFPVYVYHNPNFSGYEISVETMKKLRDMGISGVKDATFDIAKFAQYERDLAGEGFDVVLGTESIWLPARSLGAEAFIPGLANAYPELCVELHRLGMSGKFDECRKTQFLVNKVRDIMYLAESTQQAVYAMLKIRGIVDTFPRMPFTAATGDKLQKIQAALANLGLA